MHTTGDGRGQTDGPATSGVSICDQALPLDSYKERLQARMELISYEWLRGDDYGCADSRVRRGRSEDD